MHKVIDAKILGVYKKVVFSVLKVIITINKNIEIQVLKLILRKSLYLKILL